MDTNKLRNIMKQRRLDLDNESYNDYNLIINNKIINSDIFDSSKVIYCYYSINNEVCLNKTIKAALDYGKIVALPKVTGKEMSFHEIKSLEDVVPGLWGINEPVNTLLAPKADLIIVPGLAFTRDGRRIGYGGGYYDKYLSKHNARTVGVCFDFQIFDELETKKHDIILDKIITN